ncbi:MAG TPA: MauE/DoxX family redox-associated membrane protein [Microbacteriaceae bacterium]|jgi:hypothetical protein|nr:MauE/DoxX family redox-associated membrane protein [Microbacteriaceae bacterium]
MLEPATGLALFVLATYLTVSAVAKVVHPRAAKHVLVRYGANHVMAARSVVATILAEGYVALGLLIQPRSLAVLGACACLFAAFAALGLVALRGGETLDCGCLGALADPRLGWPQISQFCVVVPVLFLARDAAPRLVGTGIALEVFGVVIASSIIFLARAVHPVLALRRDRVSLDRARTRTRELDGARELLGGARTQ